MKKKLSVWKCGKNGILMITYKGIDYKVPNDDCEYIFIRGFLIRRVSILGRILDFIFS